MDYKNKYNNALEKLQEALAPKDGREISGLTRGCIEEIFPELAMSEDEKIRKEIVRFIQMEVEDEIVGNKWLAWLEKQKSVEEIVARCKDSWYNEGKIAGMAEGLSDEEKYQQGWHDALEKQNEQNHAWSEEDKNFMYDTLSNLTELKDRYGEGYGNVEKCIEWLKSLRHQKQWKPSDEQTKALEHFVRGIGESGYACPYDNDTKLIYSLLEQLKQL